MTSGSRWTSAGVPSAMRRPKSRTVTRSASDMTMPMSCSTRMTEIPSADRISTTASAMRSVSSAFMPATGSSSSSRRGSVHRARATSTRFWSP